MTRCLPAPLPPRRAALAPPSCTSTGGGDPPESSCLSRKGRRGEDVAGSRAPARSRGQGGGRHDGQHRGHHGQGAWVPAQPLRAGMGGAPAPFPLSPGGPPRPPRGMVPPTPPAREPRPPGLGRPGGGLSRLQTPPSPLARPPRPPRPPGGLRPAPTRRRHVGAASRARTCIPRPNPSPSLPPGAGGRRRGPGGVRWRAGRGGWRRLEAVEGRARTRRGGLTGGACPVLPGGWRAGGGAVQEDSD